MSCVLYYSKYCNHCNTLLKELSRTSTSKEIHFLCIDKRVKKENKIYIQLENGMEILLPPNIKCVPSLLLLNKGNQVLEGEQVNDVLLERKKQQDVIATKEQGEPCAYGLNDFGSIMSDSYSFLDQSADEMSAKGNGGLRQIHNYVMLEDLEDNYKINTPPEDYVPDKVGNMSLDQLREMREKDVPRGIMRT